MPQINSGATIDLGQRYGVGQKNALEITDKQFLGADLGYTISDFASAFPAYYGVLNGLGWSSSDMLGLTHFTAAFNDASFTTPEATLKFTGYKIKIPSGRHYYNSELRVGYATVEGDGAFFNYGQGGTHLAMTHANWKSLYGSQNDGTYLGFCPYNYAGEAGTSTLPVSIGAGYEWCHGFRIQNLAMTGTTFPDQYNDNRFREAGIMYWWPGENSGVFNVRCDQHNDFGLIISGSPAPARVRDFTGFYNKVAGIGVRGCANSDIELSMSGDFTPYLMYSFRAGETTTSPNGVAFWPDFQNINPGGTFTLRSPKLEGWAAVGGLVSHGSNASSAPSPSVLNIDGVNYDVYGKGMKLARLAGRFRLTVKGGTMYMASGQADSLVTVVDDFYLTGGATNNPGADGIPLDNSTVLIENAWVQNFRNWLHDPAAQERYELENAFPTGTTVPSSFYWRANGPAARDPLEQSNYTVVASADQSIVWPWRNQNWMAGPGAVLTYNYALPPAWGVDPVTGAPF